jgi:hypothetical protein
MFQRELLRTTVHTIARLFLVATGYLVMGLATTQFLPHIIAYLFWPLTAGCVIGLVYVMSQSAALRSLGWVRYLIFILLALAATFFLYFVMIGIGIGLLHWEPL